MPARARQLGRRQRVFHVVAQSYAEPISPGSLVSIFGSNLATTTMTAQTMPLPTELAGTSVTVNGTEAALLFVSPTQINFQAPSTLQSSAVFTQATVVVTTPVGSSVPAEVSVYGFSPGVFTANGTGCGQAVALNVQTDGTMSVNSPSNSAEPGDYVALYGTGFANSLSSFSPPVVWEDGQC